MPQIDICGRRDFPASYPLLVPLSGMGRLATEDASGHAAQGGEGGSPMVLWVVLPVLSWTPPLGDLLLLRVSLPLDNSMLVSTLDPSPCSRLIMQHTRHAFV